MTDDKLLALIEAMLFTTNEPLSIEEIAKNLDIDEGLVLQLLKILEKKYDEKSGIMLSKTGGFKLVVRPEFIKKVSHLTPHADMSRGLLRVLSLIFYHEPVKQSDIVKIVGNRTYEYVRELEKRGLIRSKKYGRTKHLETTKEFEEYFGIKKEELRKMINNERNDKLGNLSHNGGT